MTINTQLSEAIGSKMTPKRKTIKNTSTRNSVTQIDSSTSNQILRIKKATKGVQVTEEDLGLNSNKDL